MIINSNAGHCLVCQPLYLIIPKPPPCWSLTCNRKSFVTMLLILFQTYNLLSNLVMRKVFQFFGLSMVTEILNSMFEVLWDDGLIKWGSDEWQILKEMQPFVSRSQTSLDTLDFIIKSKTRYDAFYKTELNSLLISLGIETLIISGVRTNLCCETTARRGFDKNYDIVFATATENQKMHEATLLNMEYGWAKIVTAIDVIEWLAHIGKT
ncbi:unnamed protein product [Rhizophagus irregularis]|nr:unnamed protein product [Rhizophagus irregularis]